MASSKLILCEPCNKVKVNTKAGIWCYNCDEGLCATCLSQHKRSKVTRDHKTIDVTSYKLTIAEIKTECDKHGQQLNLYCPNHLMPCCEECISSIHLKCTRPKNLTDIVEKTNIEKSKESIDTEISSLLKFLDKLVDTKSKNIKAGEHTYLGIKNSVKVIRKEINKHLDHLEKKLCEETDTIWKQEKSKADDFIYEVEGKLENLKEMKESVHTITEHNTSKLQSFLDVHQIEQQVLHLQRYADKLENDERAKEVDITMKQNDKIEKVISKLLSIKALGEVMVVKTEIYFNRETRVKRGAQVEESRKQSNINNMTMNMMNIETKIATNMRYFIRDMICLMDGRVIVVNTEPNGEVKLLTADGILQKKLPIAGEAWYVTQINKNIIAISYPWEKAIKIFNIEKNTVIKVIRLDKACYCLSFFNNSLAVLVSSIQKEELRLLDLEGNTLQSTQVHTESPIFNLVCHNDRLIFIDLKGESVTCIDRSGIQIWQSNQDLSCPEGLCTDAYGNIIVADKGHNRIIAISNDGQDSKVLISQNDGLTNPAFICFRHNEPSGYICDNVGTYLAQFELSYG